MSEITRILWRSFAGGVIAPEMAGRLDLDKFQTGLKTCRNFITLPHGPAQTRAGFGYTNKAKDSSKRVRIIPFSYNNEQTFVIEFGHNYIRWHTNGATLLETAKNIVSITQASPGVIEVTGHGWSGGEWVFLTGIGGMTSLNGRFYEIAVTDADHFTLKALVGGAAISTAALPAYTAGGTAARVYTIATTYDEAHLFDLEYTQSADVLSITHPSYPPKELRRLGATNWTLTDAVFTPALAAPGSVAATPNVVGATTYTYVVTAVAADSVDESFASASDDALNDLATAGRFNTITWAAVTGASRYNVYKERNGLFGYIGQTDALTFKDDNIGADVLRTPPEGTNPFAAPGDYPGAVGYSDQRRLFGGTNNRPQNGFYTRPGTEGNMTSSIPTREDDAIFYRLVSGKPNRILHFVPLDDLLILTSGAEWRMVLDNSDKLTPGTIDNKPQSYVGCNSVKPIVTDSSVLFVQARGAHLRELSYVWERNKYTPADLSLMAPHLFENVDIVDAAYSTAPYQIAWLVRDDGTLIALTYVPEHRVAGWHEHTTENGVFESVAVVAEGKEDVLYAVVKRTVNGEVVRYIERMASRRFATLADSFCIDSGLTYSGTATTTITGLWHLEGETIACLADGAVQPPQVVTDGQITLDQAASKVHIGKKMTCELETLPVTIEAMAAGRGMLKNVVSVFLRVVKSSGIFAGPSASKLTEYRQRTTEPYGTPPNLKTDEIEIKIKPEWTRDGGVVVRQESPLPLTVAAMALGVSVAA